MKKIVSIFMAIALLAVSAAVFAEGNAQNDGAQGAPQQGQMQGGAMTGGPDQGNRPNGQPPFGGRPSGAPETSGGERPEGAPELPNGEKPGMIDFDDMAARGVISRETCDKIKAYMEEHKPAQMPEMNGQFPGGEKPADGRDPSELPDGEKAEGMPETNGRAPEAPAAGGLLKELLDAGVITQAEYDALAAAQAAEAA